MELARGTRLGPYEILAPIGSGGMGEVYRAKDTRLKREIAIKVLATHLMSDPGKRQRFEREAQAVATLSHPNICALFDVGSQDGLEFLVMEHLEGETLDRRLLRGALPLPDVLKHAVEIAAALDHAHRHGIVHRDLKPTNIMLTSAGAKLLDFGLARWHDEGGPVQWGMPATGASPPTESLTAEGAIVGTLQYMAPEQVEGKPADGRADLFAFGAIVYEMTTGRQAFTGGTHASTMAAILTADPPAMTAAVPHAPPGLERIVRKCLIKDPEARWQTARDLLDELRWIADFKTPIPETSRRRGPLTWVALGVVALVATTWAVNWSNPFGRTSADERAVRFTVFPPEQATFNPSTGFMALSPDGRELAFSATSANGTPALWIRSLDSLTARQILGTAGSVQPFWSPDGRSLGFLSGQTLKRIDPTGGLPETIVDVPGAYTGTWSHDGTFVFMLDLKHSGSLYRVSGAGEAPVAVTTLDQARGELRHVWPQFLPDGRHFLFTAFSKQQEHNRVVYVGSLDSTDRIRLVTAVSRAEYVPQGFLLYVSATSPVSEIILGGTLVAQPFDAVKLRVTGEPVRIAGPVDMTRDFFRGAFSVSQNGALVYSSVASKVLAWYDRRGTPLETIGTGTNPAIALDEQRLAFSRFDPETDTFSIWVSDLAGGNAARLTFGRADDMPLWSRDGRHVVFRKDDGHGAGLSRKATDGSGREEVLLPPQSNTADSNLQPLAWSDDSTLVITRTGAAADSDVATLPLAGERRPVPLFQEEFREINGALSPNGRWIAYVSTESGANEVYVRPFPSGDGKWKISTDGGVEPAWRRDGKELFYLAPDAISDRNTRNSVRQHRQLMAVAVRTDSTMFESDVPTPLFLTRVAPPTVGVRNQYVVSADGQRFLINQPPEGRPVEPITVLVPWTAVLKKN